MFALKMHYGAWRGEYSKFLAKNYTRILRANIKKHIDYSPLLGYNSLNKQTRVR